VAQEREGRTWTIYAHEFGSEADFRATVEQALVDIYAIVHWRGMGITVTPLRTLIEDGTYRTEGFAFAEVFMPAVKQRVVEPPAPELTDEEMAEHFPPEPVAAE
jgi:hypothetical protein